MRSDSNSFRSTINCIKLFATIFVIYIHSNNIWGYAELDPTMPTQIVSILVQCAVPLFMTISGILLFKKEVSFVDNCKKKAVSLLIPYLFWNTFWIAFEFVGYSVLKSKFTDITTWGLAEWFQAYCGIPFSGQMPWYSPLWYIRDLLILNLLAPLLQYGIKRFPYMMAIAAGVLWFVFKQSCAFFIVGGLLIMYPLFRNMIKRIPVFIYPVMGAVGVILAFFNLGTVTVICIMLCVYEVSSIITKNKQIIRWVESALCPLLFMIYVLHGKMLSILQIILTSVFTTKLSVSIMFFALPIPVVLLCLIIAQTIKKGMPKFFSFVNGGR